MTPAGWIEFTVITTVAGCILAAAVLIARAWRYDRRHPVTRADSDWLRGQFANAETGDDTLAMLCLCCNGAKGDDCICTADCGVSRCQAHDPEEALP